MAIYQSRRRLLFGAIFLIVGLFGHLLAANANGGSRLAYFHHILGFFVILGVTGAVVAGLSLRFWTGRGDITVLTIGVIQALFGVAIYLAEAAA